MIDVEKMIAVVWHSRTGTAEAMARAAAKGAGERAVLVQAEDATAELLLAADGYIFACPENLASMSGMMKEMFDRNYYGLLGKVEGRPFTYMIAGGSDGEGAMRQIERICTGWRLRKIAEPIIHLTGAQTAEDIWAPKTVDPNTLSGCENLGAAFAEGVMLGIF